MSEAKPQARLDRPQWDAEGGGLTGHALGSLLEAGNTTARAAISFHHNLYAHHKGRVPQMQAGGLGAYYDFRNNVFYNWFGTAGSKSAIRMPMIAMTTSSSTSVKPRRVVEFVISRPFENISDK